MPLFSVLPLADVPPAGPGPRLPVAVKPERNPLRYGTPLSPRERQVLQGAAQGMPNKAIAHWLQPEVTETTVKNHFTAVFLRLGANDRAHAVSIGIREGYIDVGAPSVPQPDHLTTDEISVLRAIIKLWSQRLNVSEMIKLWLEEPSR